MTRRYPEDHRIALKPTQSSPTVGAISRSLRPQDFRGETKAARKRADRAANASKRLVQRLRREFSDNVDVAAVSTKLGACSTASFCLSPACPRCHQAAQEVFVNSLIRFSRQRSAELAAPRGTLKAQQITRRPGRKPALWAAVTIVPGTQGSRLNLLGTPSIAQVHRWFTDQLAEAKLVMAVGVLEVSLVEHENDRYPARWLWHMHGLVQTRNIDALTDRLKDVFPATDMVPRPLRVVPWDGKRGWLRYAFKINTRARVGVDAVQRFDTRTGKARTCRGTTYRKLTDSERLELLTFCDRIRLDDRIVLKRAQFRTNKSGLVLVKMARPKGRKTVDTRDPDSAGSSRNSARKASITVQTPSKPSQRTRKA